MNEVRQYIRLVLTEWSDEARLMINEPPVKDLEAPEDENIDAMDPFSNANNGKNALIKSKAQAAGKTQGAGTVRGSGKMGAGRTPGGPNLGVTGR